MAVTITIEEKRFLTKQVAIDKRKKLIQKRQSFQDSQISSIETKANEDVTLASNQFSDEKKILEDEITLIESFESGELMPPLPDFEVSS